MSLTIRRWRMYKIYKIRREGIRIALFADVKGHVKSSTATYGELVYIRKVEPESSSVFVSGQLFFFR